MCLHAHLLFLWIEESAFPWSLLVVLSVVELLSVCLHGSELGRRTDCCNQGFDCSGVDGMTPPPFFPKMELVLKLCEILALLHF